MNFTIQRIDLTEILASTIVIDGHVPMNHSTRWSEFDHDAAGFSGSDGHSDLTN